jgi:hypothetical protein
VLQTRLAFHLRAYSFCGDLAGAIQTGGQNMWHGSMSCSIFSQMLQFQSTVLLYISLLDARRDVSKSILYKISCDGKQSPIFRPWHLMGTQKDAETSLFILSARLGIKILAFSQGEP